MNARIDISALGDEARRLLKRGEPVDIEHDGALVARIEPCRPAAESGLEAFVRRRRNRTPVDDRFEDDLAAIRDTANQPLEPSPWE